MGRLNRMKEELAVLEIELEKAAEVPDAEHQPEVAKAGALIEEARTAVASAFLSRRAMVLARETLVRAQDAVQRAAAVSSVLCQRSAALRRQADEIRTESARARGEGMDMARLSRQVTERTSAPSELTIDSAIPADHPEKQAIEEAVREVMSGASGLWRVWITVPPASRWWGLHVRGVGFDWVGTLQDEGEQTPEFVRARLEPLVRAAGEEVALRRRRAQRRPSPDPESLD